MANVGKIGFGYSMNYAWGGFQLKAVEGLKANLDFEYYLAANANGATTAINTYRGEVDVAYTVAGFTPEVWGYMSSKTGDAPFGVKPIVSYTMDIFTPSIYVEYDAFATPSWSAGANLSVAVEKQTIYFYFNYQSAQTWNGGVNFKMAF